MALVVRMKNVARVLLFAGSLILWVVALFVLSRTVPTLGGLDETVLLAAAVLLGIVQTWVIAAVLHT